MIEQYKKEHNVLSIKIAAALALLLQENSQITFKTKSFQKDLELLLEELENDFDMIVFFPNMEVTNIKKLNKYKNQI